MRSLTTDWNNAGYASAATFLDSKSGTYVTVPANTPVNARSMTDSVNGGDYETLAANAVPATMTNDTVANAKSIAALATGDIVVSVAGSGANSAGVRVTAVSANTALFTVSPAKGLTDASGNITFTVTGVAAGGPANLVFEVASNETVTNTVAVTITA